MSFEAYLENIRKITGRSPADFRSLAAVKGWMRAGTLRPEVKAAEIIAWLAADFGLRRGHAMAIVALLRGTKREAPEQASATTTLRKSRRARR